MRKAVSEMFSAGIKKSSLVGFSGTMFTGQSLPKSKRGENVFASTRRNASKVTYSSRLDLPDNPQAMHLDFLHFLLNDMQKAAVSKRTQNLL